MRERCLRSEIRTALCKDSCAGDDSHDKRGKSKVGNADDDDKDGECEGDDLTMKVSRRLVKTWLPAAASDSKMDTVIISLNRKFHQFHPSTSWPKSG